MGVTRYCSMNGRLRGETTSGTRTDYLTDALGSITATVNSSAVVVNTYRYKPYGQQLAKTGAGADPRYRWTGDTGSRVTNLNRAEQYNVFRHYGSKQAQWTTVDPLWPEEMAYGYVGSSPILFGDPTGMLKQTDCRQRTVEYCRDALANPTNSALRCFCRVSYLLCRFLIRADLEDAQTRRCYNCINKCLFDHYLDRHNPSSPCWSVALDPKSRACLYGGDECKWYIRCEQKTLTGCLATTCRHSCPHGIPPPKGAPKGWPFPFNGSEIDRIRRGQELCCDPGKFGQVDAGIVPIPFPIEKWGHL